MQGKVKFKKQKLKHAISYPSSLDSVVFSDDLRMRSRSSLTLNLPVSLLTFSCNAHLNHQREFNTKGHSSPLNRKIEGQGWAGKCGILELLTGEGGAWGMLPQPSLAASQM